MARVSSHAAPSHAARDQHLSAKPARHKCDISATQAQHKRRPLNKRQKPPHKKRKPLAKNGERRNSVDVIIVYANDTCASFLTASVISLQKVDTFIARHGDRAAQVGE
jgi:hypothetical protein